MLVSAESSPATIYVELLLVRFEGVTKRLKWPLLALRPPEQLASAAACLLEVPGFAQLHADRVSSSAVPRRGYGEEDRCEWHHSGDGRGLDRRITRRVGDREAADVDLDASSPCDRSHGRLTNAKPLDRPVDAIEAGVELLQEVVHVILDQHDQEVLLVLM